MLATNDTTDVIVIGSGAGGSAATYRLVRAGLRVLLVEKGAPLPSDGSTLDVRRVIHEGEFKSTEQWSDRGGQAVRTRRALQPRRQDEMVRRGAAAIRQGTNSQPTTPASTSAGRSATASSRRTTTRSRRCSACAASTARETSRGILARLARVSRWRAEPLPLGLDARILSSPRRGRAFRRLRVCARAQGGRRGRTARACRGRTEPARAHRARRRRPCLARRGRPSGSRACGSTMAPSCARGRSCSPRAPCIRRGCSSAISERAAGAFAGRQDRGRQLQVASLDGGSRVLDAQARPT